MAMLNCCRWWTAWNRYGKNFACFITLWARVADKYFACPEVLLLVRLLRLSLVRIIIAKCFMNSKRVRREVILIRLSLGRFGESVTRGRSHLLFSLPSGVFLPGVLTKILFIFLISVRSTFPAYLILLDVIILTISGEEYKLLSPSTYLCSFVRDADVLLRHPQYILFPCFNSELIMIILFVCLFVCHIAAGNQTADWTVR